MLEMLVATLVALETPETPLPIIDMHVHAESPEGMPPDFPICVNSGTLEFPGLDPAEPMSVQTSMKCSHAAQIAQSLDDNIAKHRAHFDRYNMFAMVDVTGSDIASSLSNLERWKAGLRDRMAWVGIDFNDLQKSVDPAELEAALEKLASDGTVQLFAEVDPQYEGLKATDPKFDRFFAMAERLDIPVGLHLSETVNGASHVIPEPEFSPTAGRPIDIDPLLKKYPKMRLYVMHAGAPLIDEMLYMLGSHPQLYVDISGPIVNKPKAEAHRYVSRLVEAGYASRIMFGSDPMLWPDFIPVAVDFVNEADYITDAQRRDIFYNNAARFLRLSDEEIARHHGQ